MKANESATHIGSTPYMQNRELSWLTFNERVLDQGADETVPLLERLNFISIFWSNLQEFFMVRVGSLTDLSLLKKQVLDSKTGMTPAEQLTAIHKRCHELYPVQEQTYAEVRQALAAHGVRHLRPADLNDEQRAFLADYTAANIMPFLSPQIINSRHPFPHLENGSLYVIVRLNEEVGPKKPKKKDKAKDGKTVKAAKIHPSAEESENLGAEGVTVGILPMPRQCARVIKLPGEGFQFILLEHAVEMTTEQVFSMYTVKHTNVICVTRNADLDATENTDESDEDYREHMKRILKKRGRLAPVRLESERPLSSVLQELLLDRLNLKPHQTYVTTVPLDMGWTWGLGSNLPEQERMALSNSPFTPQWPACLDRNRSIIEQVCEREVLLSYPYESMDAFVQLLREAAADPTVISIKITLYRLARQSHLAEALIAAGVARVVVGSRDPNPLVAGKGSAQLREAGIRVDEDALRAECDELNPIFFRFISRKTPYVVAKWAMSADGKIACASGDARWVSGPESRRDTHELRHRLAAIAVGINTVLADDPLLTRRRQDEPGNQPLRVVLDSHLRIPEDCALVRSCAQGEAPLAVATCADVDDPATDAGAKAQRLQAQGVEVLRVPQDAVGRVAVRPLLRALGEKDIDSLLVEGGSGIHGAFFDEGAVDEVVVYVAPKVVGGADAPGPVAGTGAARMAESTALGCPRAHALGDDLKITFAAAGAARVADCTPASRNAFAAMQGGAACSPAS